MNWKWFSLLGSWALVGMLLFSCSTPVGNGELTFLDGRIGEPHTPIQDASRDDTNRSEDPSGTDLPEGFSEEPSSDTTPQESTPPESSPPEAVEVNPENMTHPDNVLPPEQGTTTCPQGIICVTSFPYTNKADTTNGSKRFNRYNCKTSADESGPEHIYRVQLKEPGFLSAAVYDGAGVDVDVHILSSLDEKACLHRGDAHTKIDAKAGTYYIVVDSYTKSGKPLSGKYQLDIGFMVPSKGPCAMKKGVMQRVRDNGKHLPMPATGPIVMEAHLVTQKELPPYPKTSTDKLKAHYILSQGTSKFIMYRTQKWAPLEGGTFYGAGIGSPKLFPVLHESWYVNMYWTRSARPARGTRMILRLPNSKRAVVVAAGYETGPGNLAHIAGTTEETHFYMGTTHRSVMQIGIAQDQTLPFGPRTCD